MTPSPAPTHHLPCPHPACPARLPMRADLPAGDYPCACGACTVRLTWEIAGGRRVPGVEWVREEAS